MKESCGRWTNGLCWHVLPKKLMKMTWPYKLYINPKLCRRTPRISTDQHKMISEDQSCETARIIWHAANYSILFLLATTAHCPEDANMTYNGTIHESTTGFCYTTHTTTETIRGRWRVETTKFTRLHKMCIPRLLPLSDWRGAALLSQHSSVLTDREKMRTHYRDWMKHKHLSFFSQRDYKLSSLWNPNLALSNLLVYLFSI